MNSERIKQIQSETAYPNSRSVQQALFKVWNECEQDNLSVKHMHLNKGDGTSICAVCGLDLRNDVHFVEERK